MQQEIARQHFTLQSVVDTPLVAGTASSGKQTRPVSVMSLTNFVRLQEIERQAHPDIAQNQSNAAALSSTQAHLYVPYPLSPPDLQQIQLTIGAATRTLQVDTGDTRVLNEGIGPDETSRPSETVVVVSDQLYTQFASSAAPEKRWQVYSYVLPDWRKSTTVVDALRKQLPDTQQNLLTDTATANAGIEQFLSVTLFADFFVSCLFFLAAGSAIYFKLFTQQEEDQRQFHALERIGMQRREAGRLLSREFLLLFFIPVALGIVHSAVALLDLANLFKDTYAVLAIGKAFGIICLIYIACFALYFWISRVNYLSRMQLVAV